MADRLKSKRSCQGGTERAGHGIAFQQEAEFDLERGIGVIAGEPLDFSCPNQIGARVADVSDIYFVVAKNRSDHRGRHTAFFAGGLENFSRGGVVNLAENFDW